MQPFTYTTCPYPLREAIVEAHRDVWTFIAEPGSWWSGRQRVALIQASRDAMRCPLCIERKAALSPYPVSGTHAGLSAQEAGVPEAAIDAVHRIVSDPARLTRRWVESLIGNSFGYGHYVELVALVTAAITVDTVHRALGLTLEPLPEPAAGTPSGYEPAGMVMDVAWVPMLSVETLTDREGDLFLGRPRVSNVVRALSLIPRAVRLLYVMLESHYLPLPVLGDSSAGGSLCLTRPQIELLATRTSAMNECFYCTNAHAMMLRSSSASTGCPADLHAAVGAACAETGIDHGADLVRFAAAVVTDAADLNDARTRLLETGGAGMLVDAATVIATFQRMNRVADATGIPVDDGMVEPSKAMRAELGLDDYQSARLPATGQPHGEQA